MPWNLLILPLAAGYLFLTNAYITKFKQQRLDKQRLVFESVLWGVLILLITYALRVFLENHYPQIFKGLYNLIPTQIHTAYLGTAMATLLVSAIGCLPNLILNKEYFVKRAIKRVGNELELLLETSFSKRKFLQFTLDNDKVYIGFVKELPIPSVSNYVRIIPVLSGYRSSRQRRFKFTSEYLRVYSEYVVEGKVVDYTKLNVDLVISVDKIVTVSFFDFDMYRRFMRIDGMDKATKEQTEAIKKKAQE